MGCHYRCGTPVQDVEITQFLHQGFKMPLIDYLKKLTFGDKGFFQTCILCCLP